MTPPATTGLSEKGGVRATLEWARERESRWLHNSAMGALLILLVGQLYPAIIIARLVSLEPTK